MQIHRILGEKVRLYRRVQNGSWHASTYISGKERRTSTKKKSLAEAKDVAEDWYIDLRGKARHGELSRGKTFRQAADYSRPNMKLLRQVGGALVMTLKSDWSRKPVSRVFPGPR